MSDSNFLRNIESAEGAAFRLNLIVKYYLTRRFKSFVWYRYYWIYERSVPS